MAALFQILAVLCISGVILAQEFKLPDECGRCEPEKCLTTKGCTAGTMKDKCMCCDVCAKGEYELCDLPEAKNPLDISYGDCGKNLECRLRSDLRKEEGPEAVCYCKYDKTICGSNGKTYENICQLQAANATSDVEITEEKYYPCTSEPKIVSPPENVKNESGADIFLACEAIGFPIPKIEWTWTRVDGEVIFLPTDDSNVSVNMRGGPEKWEITGWLQINELQKRHEGDYTCVAQNDEGLVKATARVNVKENKEHEKNHHGGKRHHDHRNRKNKEARANDIRG